MGIISLTVFSPIAWLLTCAPAPRSAFSINGTGMVKPAEIRPLDLTLQVPRSVRIQHQNCHHHTRSRWSQPPADHRAISFGCTGMGIARAHRDSVLNSLGCIKLTMRVSTPALYLTSLKNDAGMVATEGQGVLSFTNFAFLRTSPEVTFAISTDRCSATIPWTPPSSSKRFPSSQTSPAAMSTSQDCHRHRCLEVQVPKCNLLHRHYRSISV